MIRLQDKVPEVYVDQSRDFQLLCRAYDSVLNAVKFDIDSAEKLTDTHLCRTNILQLLQTKLGFWTRRSLNYTDLRYVLEAFPIIVKNKGSLKAVRQAVYVFLKIKNIRSSVKVENILEETVLDSGIVIKPYTVVISLTTSMKDTTILEELFRYILPTGYNYYFNFVSRFRSDIPDTSYNADSAHVLFVSTDVNAQIRGDDLEYPTDMQNRVIGGVDTMSLISDGDETIETTEIGIGE